MARRAGRSDQSPQRHPDPAHRSSALGEAQTQVDVATFIAWVDADRSNEGKLADFYADRFRPEFTTAFEAWIATDPFTSPTSPSTPFEMPEYQVAAAAEADRLDVAAEASAEQVGVYIQRASNYVLSVVLYAVVLFFAGISTKIVSRRQRTVMVASGYVVFIGAVVWIPTFPISIRV